MHFDIPTIGASILSAVAGMGVVAAFLGKYLPVTKKYVVIASDALDLVDSVLDAAEEDKDGKITFTQEELTRIQVAAVKLRDAFKK